jgi:hypothetical protein
MATGVVCYGGILTGFTATRRGVGNRVAQVMNGGPHWIPVDRLRPQSHVVHRVQRNPTVPTVTHGVRRYASTETATRDGLAAGEVPRCLGNMPHGELHGIPLGR